MPKTKETIDRKNVWMREKKKNHCAVCKFVVFCCCLFICESNGWSHYLTKPTSLMWEKSTFHYLQHSELNEKEIGWSHFVCKRLTTLKGMFFWRDDEDHFDRCWRMWCDRQRVSQTNVYWPKLQAFRIIIFILRCDCSNNASNVFNWWLMTLYGWDEKHLSWCTAHVPRSLVLIVEKTWIDRSKSVWEGKREKTIIEYLMVVSLKSGCVDSWLKPVDSIFLTE